MNPDGASKAKIGDCESEVGKNNAHGVDLDINFIGKKKLNFLVKSSDRGTNLRNSFTLQIRIKVHSEKSCFQIRVWVPPWNRKLRRS